MQKHKLHTRIHDVNKLAPGVKDLNVYDYLPVINLTRYANKYWKQLF